MTVAKMLASPRAFRVPLSPFALGLSLLLAPAALTRADDIVTVDLAKPYQIFDGFGGNMAKHREETIPGNMLANGTDSVGQFCLTNLSVKHVRIGMPLGGDNHGSPGLGIVFDPNKALADQHPNVKSVINLMKTLKNTTPTAIPFSMGIWNLPDSLSYDPNPGDGQEGGRRVIAGKEADVAYYIYKFLKLATDNGAVLPDGISFNEATDTWGNDITMPPTTLDKIMTELAKLNANVKWILNDVGAAKGADYAKLCWYGSAANGNNDKLSDANKARIIAVSYHGWKSETVLDVGGHNYIAELRDFAELIGKKLWCLEVGEDPQIAPGDLDTWTYASRLAKNYFYAFKHGHVTKADYWEYMNDFRLTTTSTGGTFTQAGYMVKMLNDLIRPGMTMFNSYGTGNGAWPLAFRHVNDGRFRMFFINSKTYDQNISFKGMPAGTYQWTRCTSSENNALQSTSYTVTANGSATDTLKLYVPADSINILSKPVD
jgi:hypothetical protein